MLFKNKQPKEEQRVQLSQLSLRELIDIKFSNKNEFNKQLLDDELNGRLQLLEEEVPSVRRGKQHLPAISQAIWGYKAINEEVESHKAQTWVKRVKNGVTVWEQSGSGTTYTYPLENNWDKWYDNQ